MIICKSEQELAFMREAGRIVAETHRLMAQAIEPGITTGELDRIADQYIRSQGAVPSLKATTVFLPAFALQSTISWCMDFPANANWWKAT